MCRSIKTLRRPDSETTTGEIEAAALQFVRKVSGFREPSARNAGAFDAALAEIAASSRRLLESVGVDVIDGPNRWMPSSATGPHGGRLAHVHPEPASRGAPRA
jgi:hypothetical protein